MNNLDYWIPNCSPYISRMLYDIDNRTFTIEFVNNVNDFKPLLKFVCKSVLSYSENTVDEDYDDDDYDYDDEDYDDDDWDDDDYDDDDDWEGVVQDCSCATADPGGGVVSALLLLILLRARRRSWA